MTTTYNPGIHRFAKFVVAWTVLLFIAGALVTSSNAALSVPDWPKSFGTWFPSLRQLAGGAFFEHSHRVIAGALGIFVLVLAILIWRKDDRRWLRWLGVIAVAGVAVGGGLRGGRGGGAFWILVFGVFRFFLRDCFLAGGLFKWGFVPPGGFFG